MDEIDAIFGSPLGMSAFFYIAVAAIVGHGILLSWVASVPARRRARWQRAAARPVVR